MVLCLPKPAQENTRQNRGAQHQIMHNSLLPAKAALPSPKAASLAHAGSRSQQLMVVSEEPLNSQLASRVRHVTGPVCPW